KFETLVQQRVQQVRGEQDMAAGQSRFHELGLRAVQMREASKGQYPRGTYDRKLPSNRAGVPYPPEQRVSWLASLLPHLGHEELYQRIKFDKSWQDPDNLGVAGSLIPHFLDAGYPRNSWWVRYPGVSQDVAATHLVGMAGIGLDAAEYDPAD